MTARMRFWLIMGVAVALAVVAWALALPKLVENNAALANDLDALRDRVETATETAVGGPTLATRDAVQLRTEGVVNDAVDRFSKPDRKALDRWFDDVGRKWSARPSPGEFKRFYLLEADALRRDLTGLYEAAGLGPRTASLIQHSWMGEDETPDANALRGFQREFNVQSRVLRVLGEAGVWVETPLTVGVTAPLGGVAVTRFFDGVPVKADALVLPRNLRRALHAVDRTGKGLGIRVRNLRVSRREGASVPEEGAPPLSIVFELDVLDYKTPGKKG